MKVNRDFFHHNLIFINTYRHRDNADKTRVSLHTFLGAWPIEKTIREL